MTRFLEPRDPMQGPDRDIAERIKVRYWNEVSFMIILIFVTIAVIDRLSARIRRRLIG